LNHEQALREARARGAVIVDDSKPGQGFEYDDLVSARLDPETEKQIAELDERATDRKACNQTQELTAEVHENNCNNARKFQFDRQNEVTDYVPGRIMHRNEFLRLVRKIDKTFYYNDVSVLGLRGLNRIHRGKPEYLGAIQDGQMIEWSQLRLDSHNLPTKEKYRGWRSVLMNLIKRGCVTEDQVHAIFGKPTGKRANRWLRDLWILRNSYCPDCHSRCCDCRTKGDGLRSDNYAYERVS